MSEPAPYVRTAPDACALCGLPIGRGEVEEGVGDEELRFCCPGCKHVFLLLSADPTCLPGRFRETELYRACVKAGIIPGGEDREDREAAGRRSEELTPLPLRLRIEGMWCPSCGWLIEEILRRTPGVPEVRVSFLTDVLQATYLPHLITSEEIAGIINKLGYRAAAPQEAPGRERRSAVLRLGLSAILTANVMMLSHTLYFGFFADMAHGDGLYFSYPLLLMTTPVVFWCGYPLLRRGFISLRHGMPSMDTLVAIAVLAAFGYSVVRLIENSIHLYFDTAAMLVTFVLLGRYVEQRVREKVTSGVNQLHELSRQKVRIMEGGRERWVTTESVEPGSLIVVRAGDPVPMDGVVVSGMGTVDESALTGESRPRTKGADSEVFGGSTVREGELCLRVSRGVREGLLGQIITLVDDALSRRNRQEAMADRISRLFVPAVLVIAAGVILWLWYSGVARHDVLMRALSVLLIACPCSLGIASPLVKVAMISMARKKGILVREPDAVEQARNLDVMVIDKTGTLTEGDFRLREVRSEALPREEVLCMLASVELHSSHFLARELVRNAKERPRPAAEFREFQGMGVKGRTAGVDLYIGNRRLLERCGLALPGEMDREAGDYEKEGATVLFFGWSASAQGFLVFRDRLRQESTECVYELQGRGVAVWVVSGDGTETTAAAARAVGAKGFRGQMLPRDKADFVEKLQREGHRVGVVGDGVNDAAALARADMSFGIGAGGEIVREVSDLTLLKGNLRGVGDALDLSVRTGRTIRNNLLFAFLYNACAIPLAAAGLLNPLIALGMMCLSSLVVSTNALLLFRDRPALRA